MSSLGDGTERIAKAAAKPFQIAFGSKPKPITPAKRNRAALAADGSDHEDDAKGPVAVSGFGEDGAVITGEGGRSGGQNKKAPLVIPALKDADWRDASRRKKSKNLLPAEVQAQQRAGQAADEVSDGAEAEGQTQYGLVLAQRQEGGNAAGMGMPEKDVEAPEKARTIDDEAYARLLNGDENRSSLVIHGADGDMDGAGAQNGFVSRRAEADDFRADILSRPESSTLADYEAVPIEEFGAALLRGMGWKEGEGVGRGKKTAVQPKTLEKRPNLLGIGAKHVPENLEELGAWGKGDVKKGPKTREAYNPVVLKNSRTGEVLTEEEKKERDVKRKEVEAEAEAERRKGRVENPQEGDRHRDREHREGHRSKRYDRELDRNGRDSSRRHRSYSGDRVRRRRSRSRDRSDREESDQYSAQKARERTYRDDDKYRHRDRKGRGDSGYHRHKDR